MKGKKAKRDERSVCVHDLTFVRLDYDDGCLFLV